MFAKLVEALLLVSALSLDVFLVSMVYETNQIKIPTASNLVINSICTLVLAFSMMIGKLAGMFIAPGMARGLSVVLLALIGVAKCCDGLFKNYIRSHAGQSPIHFTLYDFHFILQVYADGVKADVDNSKVLSCQEAAMLALAVSVDGLGAGLGNGMAGASLAPTLLLCFVLGCGAVLLGSRAGGWLAPRIRGDISWLAGAMLLALAGLRAFA